MAVFERSWTTTKGERRRAFCVDYTDPQGRRRRRTFSSLKNAKNAEAAIRADILRGEFRLASKDEQILFDAFVDEYIEQQKLKERNTRTHETSKKHLVAFFGGMTLQEITVRDIEEYRAKRLKDGVKRSSVNRERAMLSGIFTLARNWGIYREDNPVAKVEKFREPLPDIRVLTIEECRQLVAACDERLRPVVIAALNLGARKMEILGLRWEDVDFPRGMVSFKKTKSKKPRAVPMNATVLRTLDGLERKGPFVFMSSRKNFEGHSQDIRKPFGEALEEAKLGHVRFHDLRHTCATRLIEAGVDLVTVSEILGHSSIQITRRYVHPSADGKRRAMEMLELLQAEGDVTRPRHEAAADPGKPTESARCN